MLTAALAAAAQLTTPTGRRWEGSPGREPGSSPLSIRRPECGWTGGTT